MQEYLPEALQGRIYYTPSDEGYERTLADRLEAWRTFRDRLSRAGLVGRRRSNRDKSQASSRGGLETGAGGATPEEPAD